jgi:hypothetical protein
MKSRHIYICSICQWQINTDAGYNPQPANGPHQQPLQYGYGPPAAYPPPKH